MVIFDSFQEEISGRIRIYVDEKSKKERSMSTTLSELELADIDPYWRAANYLSIGQIYMLDNPL